MFYEPTIPSAAQRDLFGREFIADSGIGKQAALFHEPVMIQREPAKPIGAAEANRPENTTEMFPPATAREELEVMSLTDLQRAAEALRLEHDDCIGAIGRAKLVQRILEAQGMEDK